MKHATDAFVTLTQDPRPRTRARSRGGLVVVLCLMGASGLLIAGCNILGPVGYFIHGPEKTPAVYTLPENKTTVIFIADRKSAIGDRSLRRRASQTAERLLLDNEVVTDLLDSQSIQDAAASDRFSKPRGIVELGEAVGAQVVIYVAVDTFSLSSDGVTYQPTATFRVKVMDVETKERLWPDEPQEWFPMSVTTMERPQSMPSSTTDLLKARQDLADRLGRTIGEMFIKHIKASDSRVGES